MCLGSLRSWFCRDFDFLYLGTCVWVSHLLHPGGPVLTIFIVFVRFVRVVRPEDGLVPVPGQNPADFILVAGQSAKLDSPPSRGQRASRPTLSLLQDDDDDDEIAGTMKYAVGFSAQVSHRQLSLHGDVWKTTT